MTAGLPVADAATMLTVLNTMDNGVYDFLLYKYGGAGQIANNRFRYAVASWYLYAVSQDNGYFVGHNDITITSDPSKPGTKTYTCECGITQDLPEQWTANFGQAEYIVYHQIDNAWQTFPPKDRPQWWQYR